MEWKHALPGQKGAFVWSSGSYAMGVLKGKARVARAYAVVRSHLIHAYEEHS